MPAEEVSSPASALCDSIAVKSQSQQLKTFSKDAFKTSLLGTAAFDSLLRSGAGEDAVEGCTERGEDINETETAAERSPMGYRPSPVSSDETVPSHDTPTPKETDNSPENLKSGSQCVEATSPTSVSINGAALPTPKSASSSKNELDAFDFAFDGFEKCSDDVENDMMNNCSNEASPLKEIDSTEEIDCESMRSIIRFLIEVDDDNINLSTKAWMAEIAQHLKVKSLPKDWKPTIQSLLLEEASAYTNTQEEKDSVSLVESDDDTVEGQSVSSLQLKTSPVSNHSQYEAKDKKNEELQVMEELQAEKSEREYRMLEFITR